MYKVYIQVDTNGRITAINSSAFLADTDGWIEIDSGEGDRYHHAQGNYLNQPIMTNDGVYRYKYAGGAVVERTAEEIAADKASIPVVKTDKEVINEVLDDYGLMIVDYEYRLTVLELGGI